MKDGENEHKRICGLPLNSLWNTTLETLSRKKKSCLIPIWIKKDSFILILREDTSFVKAMMGFCIMKRNAKVADIYGYVKKKRMKRRKELEVKIVPCFYDTKRAELLIVRYGWFGNPKFIKSFGFIYLSDKRSEEMIDWVIELVERFNKIQKNAI